MNDGRYILNESGEVPVRCDDLMEWASWFEDSPLRRVALTTLDDGILVSTVFLGLDHGFHSPNPVLWETMVFRADESIECDRCAGSRKQALAMHESMIERVQFNMMRRVK